MTADGAAAPGAQERRWRYRSAVQVARVLNTVAGARHDPNAEPVGGADIERSRAIGGTDDGARGEIDRRGR